MAGQHYNFSLFLAFVFLYIYFATVHCTCVVRIHSHDGQAHSSRRADGSAWVLLVLYITYFVKTIAMIETTMMMMKVRGTTEMSTGRKGHYAKKSLYQRVLT